MRYVLTFVVLAFTLAGCPQPKQSNTRVTPPPSGQGHFTTDDGVRLTLFTPMGRIKYGETKSGTIAAGGLTGFVVAANPGDRPVFTLRSRSSGTFSVTAYGPRSSTGLWGDHSSTKSGAAPTILETWMPTSSGDHFVLLRVFGAASADIEVTVTCEGCAPPECEALDACNVYCPDGLVHDDDGCLGCTCSGATCPSTGCQGDGLCVFPCGRGTCPDGDTCIGGQCEQGSELCGVERCERGKACVDGECRPTAFECKDPTDTCRERCPDDLRPVCAVVEDRRQTFTNRCEAECGGAEAIMDGRCESGCGPMNPCDEGLECVRGQCRPRECECPNPSEDMRVCGRSGATHPSACHAQCAEDPVAYRGECGENSCESSADCQFDQACIPVLRGSTNRGRMCDPESDPDCILQCRPLPRCSTNEPCPRRQQASLGCYPVTSDVGICLPTCNVQDPSACRFGHCASILHRRGREVAAEGICLPQCESDEQCPGSLRCLPDLSGTRVCQTCACGNFPSEQVCTGRGIFENRCLALCAGLGSEAVSRPIDREVCDSRDNDCDGRIDEDIARRACGQDVGECRAGVQECTADGEWSACVRSVGPRDEVCDGLDNDCDGHVDEANDLCPNGEPCPRPDHVPLARDCGIDSDNPLCGQGRQECVNGSWSQCVSFQAPSREICDEIDNDCDGRVDEAADGNGAGPDNSGCGNPQNPCQACPTDWRPVCSRDGTVYANECEVRCADGVDALQPLQRCYGLAEELPVRCRADNQCRQMGRDGQLCLNVDAGADAFADVSAPLSEWAECLANTGTCACAANRCGFIATAQTRRCLPMAQVAPMD